MEEISYKITYYIFGGLMNTQPLFSSMHIHTKFCDGRDDIETMCQAAYDKSLFAIGFSSHAPTDKQLGSVNGWNMKSDLIDEYVTQVLAAKERWRGKLNVFLGLEVDYIKGKRSPLDSDIVKLNLDYIIGSVHYLFPENGTKGFTVDGSREEFDTGLKDGFGGDAQKLMHSYYDAVAEMIKIGGFDIIGHADLLKKNTLGMNLWSLEAEAERQKEITNFAKKAKLVFEVNTGGINRNKIQETYPSLSFLKIIKKFNVPVTITADAHCARDVNGNYTTALNILKEAGIKKHFIFKEKTNKKKSVWLKEIVINN
jgi:histidinol-phosphatase (PHP family)